MREDLEFVRNNINLDKKIWHHILTTNCYAYALGIDIKEKISLQRNIIMI